jgi:hypothetical protein
MTGSILLDMFVDWGRGVAAEARSSSLIADLEICVPTTNPAAKLNLEGRNLLARITYWADGSFYAEAIDAATSAQVLSRHGLPLSARAFDEEFKDVLDSIGAGATDDPARGG